MKHRAPYSTLVANDLRTWLAHRTWYVGGGLAIGLIAVTLATTTPDSSSLFTVVLGGPTVAWAHGQLREGPGWTGFMMEVLFLVAGLSLLDTPSQWRDLMLIRGVPPGRWAAGRLGALAIAALGFLTLLIGVMGLAVVTRWQSGPLVSPITAWDVGLWALDLIGLAWFTLAIHRLTDTLWWSFLATLCLLSLARFGGGLSPDNPFAQWMVGLHHLPGTLSVTQSALYLLGITVCSGLVVLLTPRLSGSH